MRGKNLRKNAAYVIGSAQEVRVVGQRKGLSDNADPMNVTFAIFQTDNRANGGLESITKVIEHAHEIDPVIVTQRDTAFNRRWEQSGADVRVWSLPYQKGESFSLIPSIAQFQRLRSLVATNLRMYRLIKETGCRVLHCNDSAAMYHTLVGGWLAGVATVHNIRDTKLTTDVDGIWKWMLARQLLSQQLVLSDEMRRFWKRAFGLNESTEADPPIDYIYSIVNPDEFSPVSNEQKAAYRAELGIAEDETAIGYIAGVNPKKAQLKFIEQAGPYIAQQLPKIKIYFVGDFDPRTDNYCSRCQQVLQRHSLEDTFEFVGYDPNIVRWYRAVDIGLVASREEGLARCMIESLSCGTPVVSFDVCSAREILEENDCGLVVSQGNYDDLAATLEKIVQNEAMQRRFSKNAVELARTAFDPSSISEEYVRLYRRLSEQVPV